LDLKINSLWEQNVFLGIKYHRIIIKNKARLVVKGYNQEENISYEEIFALVARLESIRML
jgi:hypothetical protein